MKYYLLPPFKFQSAVCVIKELILNLTEQCKRLIENSLNFFLGYLDTQIYNIRERDTYSIPLKMYYTYS